MDNKIKACPFCSGTHTVNSMYGIDIDLTEDWWDHYFILCDGSKGGCGAVGGAGINLQEAIKRWNRRNG